jgi:hypothetical protein
MWQFEVGQGAMNSLKPMDDAKNAHCVSLSMSVAMFAKIF